MRGLRIAIIGLALAGIGLSAVSAVNHYRTDPTSYCDFSEDFNCDIVNRSIYSRFPAESAHAVPVAVIGLAGYIAIGTLAALRGKAAKVLLMLAALGGLGFSLYLTYVEARVLHVWCILCLGSLAVIALITLLAGARLAIQEKETP
ncbi:MAG TPA: vitamin K epoxide reductase family protein [Terriglobales bacterium]|nr:vitamin K epoxide reductase family protein [Terriglobales bacterium]